MLKNRAVAHFMENDCMDRAEALQKWDDECEATPHKRYDGPGGALRIPIKVEDFLVAEDALINEKSKELSFKRAKYSLEQDALMDEGLEAGRPGSSEDFKQLGFKELSGPGVFGRQQPIQEAEPVKLAEDKDSSGKKKVATFDAAMERLALQNKLLQALDREVQALLGVHQEVCDAMDADFEAALTNPLTPSNEVDAMHLMKARLNVSKALVGNYKCGSTAVDEASMEADVAVYEQAMSREAAQLSDVFLQAQPLLHNLQTLLTAVKAMTNAAEKKSLETEFRPVLTMVSVMRSSLRGTLEKARRFVKDRASKEEKAKRAQEAAESKKIQAEAKKRAAEDKKRSTAAEKQGRVMSMYDIDVAKLGVKNMDQLTLNSEGDIDKLDWSRPFVVMAESSVLKGVATMLSDSRVKATLDSFYQGFPGSAAALQGSKRFTTPVKESVLLQKMVLGDFKVKHATLTGLFTLLDECEPTVKSVL